MSHTNSAARYFIIRLTMPAPKANLPTGVTSTLSIIGSIVWGTFYFEGKVKEIFMESLKPFDTRMSALENNSKEFKEVIEILEPTVKLNEYKITQLQDFILPERPRLKREK